MQNRLEVVADLLLHRAFHLHAEPQADEAQDERRHPRPDP
jgi:hypothetical protein